MANKHNGEFFDLLRARGLRKRVARDVAALEGNRRRAGAKGENIALQAVEDLDSAAGEIRTRVLRNDRTRSQAARRAAQTRQRNAKKRAASAKKGAQTRARVARTRGNRRATSKRA